MLMKVGKLMFDIFNFYVFVFYNFKLILYLNKNTIYF